MSHDPMSAPGARPMGVVVTSPSGVPVRAWAWAAREGEPATIVAAARMTLRLDGDDWTRAEAQDSLADAGASRAATPSGAAPVTRVSLAPGDTSAHGPIAPHAEVVLPGPRATRLRAGSVALIATQPGGTLRVPFEIGLLSWDEARGRVHLELSATVRVADVARARLLLAVDDAARVEDEESTLTTPGAQATSGALPFVGGPTSPFSEPRARATTGLPFGGEGPAAGPVAAPSAQPGQSHTMFLARTPHLPAPMAPPAPLVVPARPAPVAPPPLVAATRPESATEASDRAAGPGAAPSTRGDGVARRADAIALLWTERAAVDRIRTRDDWRALLRSAEDEPAADDPGDDATVDIETRRAVVTVILGATPTSPGGLGAALARAFEPRGAFRAPLALVRGHLVMAFDEAATLRAYVAATRAPAAADASLGAAWKPAADLAAEGDPLTPVAEIDAAVAALRAAFASGPRPFDLDRLDARVRDTLAARRLYKAVQIGGEPHVRGAIGDEGGAGVPIYLPEPCARCWPPVEALAVHALVAIGPPEEPALDADVALRCIALARGAPRADRRTT